MRLRRSCYPPVEKDGLTRFAGLIYGGCVADRNISKSVIATAFPGILSILLIPKTAVLVVGKAETFMFLSGGTLACANGHILKRREMHPVSGACPRITRINANEIKLAVSLPFLGFVIRAFSRDSRALPSVRSYPIARSTCHSLRRMFGWPGYDGRRKKTNGLSPGCHPMICRSLSESE